MIFLKVNGRNILGLSVNPFSLLKSSPALSDFNKINLEWNKSNVIPKIRPEITSTLPTFNKNNFPHFVQNSFAANTFSPVLNQVPNTKKVTLQVWGINNTYSRRVFKWNELKGSWDQPSPNVRLNQIDVGVGGAMGHANNGRIYLCNKSTDIWYERPKPDDTLFQLSNLSYAEAWGIAMIPGGVLLVIHTSDGIKWYRQYNAPLLKQISVGEYPVVYGLRFDGTARRYEGGGSSPNAWGQNVYLNPNPNNDSFSYISACRTFPGRVWAIGTSGRVYLSIDHGDSWTEPNKNARLTKIAGLSEYEAWGIGSGGRVFRWNWKDQAWDEPNPAADFVEISAAFV